MPLRILCILLLTPLLARADPAAAPTLTFVAWSDQHILYDGNAAHLAPAIDAINSLQPPPAFVLGCGDCTDWPTPPAVRSWNQVSSQIHAPSYTVLGNHDEGRDPANPSRARLAIAPAAIATLAAALLYLALSLTRLSRPTRLILASAIPLLPGLFFIHRALTIDDGMKDWLRARHGSLTYTFDHSGIHFICLFTPYTSPETIGPEALSFIRKDLSTLPGSQPVILVTHYCFESIHNKDALIDALGNSNTLLILSGHHHASTSHEYRGRHFLQIPSPRYTPWITQIQITPDHVIARNYNFKTRQFSSDTNPTLDVSRLTPERK